MINVTHEFPAQILEELSNTPVLTVKIYTMGSSKITHRQFKGHEEITVENEWRSITPAELARVHCRFINPKHKFVLKQEDEQTMKFHVS